MQPRVLIHACRLTMKKIVVKSVNIKQQFVRKLRAYGAGTLRIWIQRP